jgi:SAM-dependent methyltransferase
MSDRASDYDACYRGWRERGMLGWGGSGAGGRRDGWRAKLESLRHAGLLPPPPVDWLELGCGTGFASRWAAERGYRVAGVDISREAIAWATDEFAVARLRGDFRAADVGCGLPFGDAAFNLVVDGNCLHCLIGDARGRCLAEVRRLLRAHGRFVVSSMCGEPKYAEDRALFQAGALHRNGSPWRTLKPAPEIEREIIDGGFSILSRAVRVGEQFDHLTLVAA